MGQLKYARVQKNYDSDFKRLEVNCLPGTDADRLWTAMKAALLQCPRVEELQGIAPPGDLARRLQEWLDAEP